MISQAIAALQKALGLRTSGSTQEAINVIEHALEGLFDLHFNLIYLMEDERLYKSLEHEGELNYDLALVTADIFREAGILYTQLNRPIEATVSNGRALRLYIEFALGFPEGVTDELKDKIAQLRSRIEFDQLSLETQLALEDYLDREGDTNSTEPNQA